jgi:hypothetical protein
MHFYEINGDNSPPIAPPLIRADGISEAGTELPPYTYAVTASLQWPARNRQVWQPQYPYLYL